MNILITGATGFLGRALTNDLYVKPYSITALVRNKSGDLQADIQQVMCHDLCVLNNRYDDKVLTNALEETDVIIHTAARVHVMNDEELDPLEAFRKVNTRATLSLAQQAASAGVKRFIFISSVKVNGEDTSLSHPFTPNDKNIPEDPYGLSKYEAEQGLLALAEKTDMEVVIIRPPLVYGPGVKANFAVMMHRVNQGLPLPLGLIKNQRSLIGIDNLVSFISVCIEHPKAANQVFLISDGEDVSTSELLRKVAKALGKKPRLIPVPVSMMKLAAKIIGKGDVADRLFGSLQVDSSKARDLLGWHPVITMDEQLKKTADAYLEHEKTL